MLPMALCSRGRDGHPVEPGQLVAHSEGPPSHYVEVFNLLGGGLRDGDWRGESRPKGGHAPAILLG